MDSTRYAISIMTTARNLAKMSQSSKLTDAERDTVQISINMLYTLESVILAVANPLGLLSKHNAIEHSEEEINHG